MAKYKIKGKHTTFTVGYNAAGRLKSIAHVAGNNDDVAWMGLVNIVPNTESDLSEFIRNYRSLKVTAMTKAPDTLYKHYVSDWFLFYYTINDIEPKFTGTDGKCIREIMKHFETVSDTPENARAAWQALLAKWNTLPDFYRKKTELTFINARLNEIITHLKDEGNTKAQADRDAADLRR